MILVLAATLVGEAAASAATGAAATSSLRAELARAWRGTGATVGAYVADIATPTALFSFKGAVARSPASVEKLYTTATALARFGVDGELDTTVLGVGRLDANGTWLGDLYLHGGGDPTFGSGSFIHDNYSGGASVEALALALEHHAGITRVTGSVIGDESLLDGLRGGPDTSFAPDPEITGTLSALAFDRGRAGSTQSPADYAALRLAGALRHDGVVVDGRTHTGTAPPSAALLAAIGSPPMRTLARMTDLQSDNFFAEMLLKDLGAYYGHDGSTAGGSAVVRQWLAQIGVHPRIYDGSGLDRADHTSPAQVVALLRSLAVGVQGAALRAALPVAGRSGTLTYRMRATAAAGHCEAKTGTLSDASALAGWCDGATGPRFAFAFLANHADVTSARAAEDRMTVTLARFARP